MYSKGIAPDIRAQILTRFTKGASKIKDIELTDKGVVVLYDFVGWWVYNGDPRLIKTLQELDRSQRTSYVRSVRMDGEGGYVLVNTVFSAFLGEGKGKQLLERLGAAANHLTEARFLGPNRYFVVRDYTDSSYSGIPQSWVESLRRIHDTPLFASPIVTGLGDDGGPAFFALTAARPVQRDLSTFYKDTVNGANKQFSWEESNAPREMMAVIRRLYRQNDKVECVAMRGSSWIVIGESEKNKWLRTEADKACAASAFAGNSVRQGIAFSQTCYINMYQALSLKWDQDHRK